ncbi:MAG: C4-dicarboxylate ABC transporter substrate-binding protein [Paracoccaceae bacterium]|nr:MAG: TRAP transporter small permease [Alphaproteobacteria bacterium]GIX15364.1 MAG: C4-dicarboxylate ABC transporter substrate-binding protein [Paracoccaceae bacterium]
MKTLERGLGALATALGWIAAAAVVMMMLHVVADVFMREVFNRPIVGTVEISAFYYMVILSFLPLAAITRERGHIIVELFTGWMSLRGRTALDGLVAVVTFAYVATFTWKALEMAVEKTAIREAKEAGIGFVEIWPSRWVVVAGFGFMAIYVLIHLVQDLRAAITGRLDPADAPLHPGGAPHVPDSERQL